MGLVLLVVHIGAAILFVGPASVAASMFPAVVPLAPDAGPPRPRDARRNAAAAAVLHRVSRVYGTLALIVPAAGLALGLLWNEFDQVWLVVALCITVVAGAVLALRVVPAQAAALAAPPDRRALAAQAAVVGVFNLLWVVVLVLMVVQPGAPER